MKKHVYFFFSLTLIISIISTGIAVWVAGTTAGARWLMTTVNHFEPRLEVDVGSGSFWSGLRIDSLTWNQSELFLRVEGFDSRWNFGCLLDNKFCIKKLSAQTIIVRPGAATEEEVKTEPTGPIVLPEISLPLGIELDDLRIGQVRIETAESVTDIQSIALQAAMAGDQLSIHGLSVGYENFSAELSGKLQLAKDYPINITAKLLAEKLLDNQDAQLELRVSNTVAKLQIEAELTGAIAASLKGQTQPLLENLPYSAALNWKQIDWPPTGQTPLIRTTDGQLNAKGEMLQYELDLRANIEGKDIPESAINLQAKGDESQLNIRRLVATLLDGKIALDGQLRWQNQLAWNADIQLDNINPGAKWPDYPGRLTGSAGVSGSVVDDDWRLAVRDLAILGDFREHPFELKGQLEKESGDKMTIETLSLKSGDNSIFARGALDGQWDIDGRLDLGEMDVLAPDLDGRVHGEFKVTGALNNPDIQAKLAADNLSYGENRIESLKLLANVKALGMVPSSLQLTANSLAAGETKVDTVELKLNGTRTRHDLQFAARAPDYRTELRLEGSLQEDNRWDGLLANARIEGFEHTLQLSDQAAMSWEPASGQFHVQPHCWLQQSAQLCLTDELIAAEQGAVKLKLSGYDLAWIKPFLPEHLVVAGLLSADSQIQWTPDQRPTAALNVQIDNGAIGMNDAETQESIRFEIQTMTLAADAAAETVEAKLTLRSQDIGNADIALSLLPLNDEKPIAGTAKLEGLNIAFLRSFVPQIETLTGTINADGSLAGTLAKPQYIGNVVLDGLNVASPDLPIGVKNGNIRANIEGTQGTIEGNWQSGEGPVKLTGQANWSTPQWLVDLQIKGDRLNIDYKPMVQARASPDISIRLQPLQVDINGKVEIPYGRITLKELPENATAVSSDVVIVSDQPEPETEPGPWTVRTRLLLVLGNDVKLSALGLQADLAGDLRLEQTKAGELDAFGEIRVVKGIYKAYGQNLEVENGRLLFVGPIQATALDIDAVRKVQDVTAGLRLRGTFEEPEITLFSRPSLPQEDILSYIVLGRPMGARGSGDGNILASAALALGIKGGRGIATDIASKFGISDFEIETAGDGDDSQVVVSGRLSRNLMVRYGVGVFTPENTLSIRYNLTQRLYVEAIQGLESALDIFYSFDF